MAFKVTIIVTYLYALFSKYGPDIGFICAVVVRWLSLTRNSGLRMLASRNWKHPSIVWCEVFFQCLELFIGADHKCAQQTDRQKNGRTDFTITEPHFTMSRGRELADRSPMRLQKSELDS